jgi:hypothetical protein
MIPAELAPRRIRLPEKGDCHIVVFTGSSLRHDRFALRVQKEFGERVVGWFQSVPRVVDQAAQMGGGSRLYAGARSLAEDPRKFLRVPRFLAEHLLRRMRRPLSQDEVERRLFGDEVRWLRKTAHLEPIRVENPNAPEVVKLVKSMDPYLILTLGGPLYTKPLLDTVIGLALNQHDGWCPEYKGSGTVYWALYHRDISCVANTVHILTSGADAGPIVRRSTACLVEEDTYETCFARSVALGTELMCEVVGEVIRSESLTVYDQPDSQGFTYLSSHLNDRVTCAVDRDLREGLLSVELSRLRHF